MADVYVNADVEANKKSNPAEDGGAKVVEAIAIAELAVADSDGDIFRLFSNIPASAVIASIQIVNDAVTGGTDFDLGFYKTNGGAVVDKDALLDGVSMASARARGSELNGLTAVAIENSQKQVYELAGDTLAVHDGAYDIALTANTVGSSVGTIVVAIRFIQG